MLEVGRGLDLGEESLGSDYGGQLWSENLEGHLPIVPHIVGEIDGGHAALAQLPLDAVAVGEGGRESLGWMVNGFAASTPRTSCPPRPAGR